MKSLECLANHFVKSNVEYTYLSTHDNIMYLIAYNENNKLLYLLKSPELNRFAIGVLACSNIELPKEIEEEIVNEFNSYKDVLTELIIKKRNERKHK